MNFLCHALPYFDSPLFAVSTGIPDWLSVVDRKIRARRKLAEAHLESEDVNLRSVAKGIVQHITDDHWFHSTEVFTQSNLELAMQLREQLPGDSGFRPMFVGHIVIEMLMDAVWIGRNRALGEGYYSMLASLDASEIQRCVNVITGKPTEKLSGVIERFVEMQFLYDYLDPESLLMRLNQVMKRVGLERLPDSLLPWLVETHQLVESRLPGLLTPPDGRQLYDF